MRRQPRRWLLAAWVAGGLGLLIIMAIVILPPVLSADYHRAAIEALASRLTGRQVVIKGPIRLSMVPAPQLRATDIRIDVPHGEQISAASLRLDLAPRALLLGRLRATRLTLRAPLIIIPWPLPDGAASILPPPWLASLHAKIEDGTIILARLALRHADLSIFTGGGKAILAASGAGAMFGMPVSAKLSLAGINSKGMTPVTASIATPAEALARQKAGLSFSGAMDAKSLLTGSLAGSAVAAMAQSLPLGHVLPAAPVEFSATVSASRAMVSLSAIKLAAGTAMLRGSAMIDLTTGVLSLMAQGHGVDITPLARRLAANHGKGAVNLRARLTDATLGGFGFPELAMDLGITQAGTTIRAFSASLPGQGRLGLDGVIGPPGLRGNFTLADQAPAALLKAAAKALPALSGWPPPTEALHLAGSIDAPFSAGHPQGEVRLGGLHGDLGSVRHDADHQNRTTLSTGAVVATLDKAPRLDIAASLGFDRLDATNLMGSMTRSQPINKSLRLDLALTARQARLGAIAARHLALDARLGNGLTIRALDFYAMTGRERQKPAALVILRGVRAAGVISGADLLVAGPDAARAMALLPRHPALLDSAPFKSVMRAPFAASFKAAGKPDALESHAVVDLGDMRIRAAPLLNLLNHTASGPLSFRMPDAIALAKPWDKQAGLAWPGAGSAGLRADFTAAPRHFGLSSFVLSFGALTASGRLVLDYGASPFVLAGVVNADTLALPPAPALLQLANAPSRLSLQLPDITAAHLRLGETDVADDASASLAATPRAITLQVRQAKLAGGALTGQAALSAANGGTPPSLKADLELADADAAALQPAFAAAGLPAAISSGSLTAVLHGQATGYTAKTWAATLGGTLTASGKNLTVQGLGLAGAAALMNAAATAPNAAQLQQALLSGATNFTAMTLDGNFASGAFTINKAKLTGDAGSAKFAGNVDVPDHSLAVIANLQPASPGDQPPPTYKVTLSGPWANPKRNLASK